MIRTFSDLSENLSYFELATFPLLDIWIGQIYPNMTHLSSCTHK